MGGSQGAADLNGLVPAAADRLAATGGSWQILNLTGPRGARGRRELQGVPVLRLPFLVEMAAAWALADVALCRAGAGTVAELAATGTPAVIVPYPHHADRHQAANAAPLVEAGGALIVPADDPTGERTAIELLGAALQDLPAMATAARRRARPEACRLVAAIVRAAGDTRRGHPDQPLAAAEAAAP